MLDPMVRVGFPESSVVKRICLQCERPGFDPWIGKIPWRRERLPTSLFWPGEFHVKSMGSQRVYMVSSEMTKLPSKVAVLFCIPTSNK